MFKFLTNNKQFDNEINRRNERIDILNRIHEVFYHHTDSENHGAICWAIYENIHNQIMNGNYFTPFDIFERYTNEYRVFGEQLPGFSEMEFMMLMYEAERRVRYNQL